MRCPPSAAAHHRTGQRDDRQPAGERVEARVATRPVQRVEHRIADAVDAQVIGVREARQHDRALADREAARSERALESAHETIGQRRMTALEEHQCRITCCRDGRRQQVVVVRVHLEQRLRAEQQHLALRQREARTVGVGRNHRRRVLRADPRQQDQPSL